MGGSVPDALAHEVHGNRWRMDGTERHPVRCVALTGRCGKQSICSIYERRPSTCDQFQMGAERCNEKIHARHGLPPLYAPWKIFRRGLMPIYAGKMGSNTPSIKCPGQLLI